MRCKGEWLALNVGTCLYMAWTGLCLMQCTNSIVWNNNTVLKRLLNMPPTYFLVRAWTAWPAATVSYLSSTWAIVTFYN
ncbi:hypothetical protein BC826DRAFT_140558 [Russula brevipes]|nr:hypothetical protein BC826DRAFT_140558 [Russula brevipes]